VCKLSAFQHTSVQDLWAILRLGWCCSGRCRVITRPRNAISKRRTAISFRMSVLNPTAAASIASSALRATTRPIHLAPAAARYTSHALRRTGFAPGFVVVRWSFWFRHSAGTLAKRPGTRNVAGYVKVDECTLPSLRACGVGRPAFQYGRPATSAVEGAAVKGRHGRHRRS
jgi:hypothetical protein